MRSKVQLTPRKTRSKVWCYFERVPCTSPQRVKCKLCGYTAVSRGTTTGMQRHLKAAHPTEGQREEEEVEEDVAVVRRTLNNGEMEQEEGFDAPDGDSDSQEPPSLWLVRSFATGGIPFRFAANPEFRRFCHSLNADFVVPSASSIAGTMRRLNERHLNRVRAELAGVEHLVLLTDDDVAKRFRSCHVVYVDDAFRRRQLLVCVDSSEDVASRGFSTVLATVGVAWNVVKAIVTSDGGVDAVGIPSLPCAGHLLRLILDDFETFLSDDVVFGSLLATSSHIARLLAEKRGDREDVHRVSSSRESLPTSSSDRSARAKLLTLKAHHAHFKAVPAIVGILPTPQQEALFDELMALLEPVFQSIQRLERDSSYATDVIPTLLALQETLDKQSNRSKRLHDIIGKRLGDYVENDDFIRVSMILDPRYAYLPRIFADGWTRSEALIRKQFDRSEEEGSGEAKNPKTSSRCDDDDDFMKQFVDSRSDPRQQTSLATELQAYLALLYSSRPSHCSDPLEFWCAHANTFPNLANAARIYLTPTASAATSHRLYRKCTDIVRQRNRNEIDAETTETVLFTAVLTRKDVEMTKEEDAFGWNEDDDDDDDEDVGGEDSEVFASRNVDDVAVKMEVPDDSCERPSS